MEAAAGASVTKDLEEGLREGCVWILHYYKLRRGSLWMLSGVSVTKDLKEDRYGGCVWSLSH